MNAGDDGGDDDGDDGGDDGGGGEHDPALLRAVESVHATLCEYYRIETQLTIGRFLKHGELGSREVLLLRQRADELELCLMFPPDIALDKAFADSLGRPATLSNTEPDDTEPSDTLLQIVEGTSHFLFVVERARIGLPTTQLELELQAEVDKFVVLSRTRRAAGLRALHSRLYERVHFLHDASTEAGARYRLANQLAARFVHRHLARDLAEQQATFRRFHRAGQAEKIRLAS